MIPNLAAALVNHLWQSTVFTGIAGLLALALRRNQARWRHGLWLLASVKFLVPFALFAAVGAQLAGWMAWPGGAGAAAPELSAVVEQISQPFPSSPPAAMRMAPSGAPAAYLLSGILLAIWACGFLAIGFRWGRRWRELRAVVRAASPLSGAAGVPILSSPASSASWTGILEPGVFGIFRPVLLLPGGIADRLAPAHLEAIVAHELCHIRRRDNLTSAIHMAVEAVFWFHPLVWYVGARLVEERERACDEEVLRLGSRPEVYAESILKTCQFYLESPLECMSGIAGSDLKKRIVRIMTGRAADPLGLGRRLLLGAAGIAAVAGPVVFGLVSAPPSRAQSPVLVADHPSFDVASIKPNHSGTELFRINAQPDSFAAENATVIFLLQHAYNVKEDQISEAPGWAASEHYDVKAKVDESRAEQGPQLRLMLQSLLAERFKLVLHHETKELPIYALVVGRSGPKFQESAPAPEDAAPPVPLTPDGPQPRGSIRMGRGELHLSAQNLNMFADVLSHQLGRLVVNKTGLEGRYDFSLKWTPEEADDASGPSMSTAVFTAVQEQLGLKLESQKGPVDTLVIDHIERPSEN